MRFLLCFLLLSACTTEPTPLQSYRGTKMTIPYEVQVTGSPEKIIRETFQEVDAHFNKWNPLSEISQFNAFKETSKFLISDNLYQLLLKVNEIVVLTNGYFDPTIEPLETLWKKALQAGREPSLEEIDQLTHLIGWNHIHFDSHHIWKDHPETEIDLGGIAKGYAVDLLYERLEKGGFVDIYVEWGGEIRVSASHPSGRVWKVGVEPLDESSPPLILSLSKCAVATSGDYEQFWRIKGPNGESITYYHLIDPFEKRPLRREVGFIGSFTVIAPTCLLADGLAKMGLFLKTEEQARKFFEKIPKESGVKFFSLIRKLP